MPGWAIGLWSWLGPVLGWVIGRYSGCKAGVTKTATRIRTDLHELSAQAVTYFMEGTDGDTNQRRVALMAGVHVQGRTDRLLDDVEHLGTWKLARLLFPVLRYHLGQRARLLQRAITRDPFQGVFPACNPTSDVVLRIRKATRELDRLLLPLASAKPEDAG